MKSIMLIVLFACSVGSINADAVTNTISSIWHTITKRGDDAKLKSTNDDNINTKISDTEMNKSLSEIYEERKAIFEKKQEEAKKKQIEMQETKPSLIVFTSQDDSVSVERSFNDIETPLRKALNAFENLSQDLYSNLLLLKTDDDIANEMEKSIVITDIIKRTTIYLKLALEGIKEINSGVAVLCSINSITDNGYAIGCDQIVKGLAILNCEKFIYNTINYEIEILLKITSSRHQDVFGSVLEKHLADVSDLSDSIKKISELYDNEICPKIKREDLSTSFNEKQQSIRNIVSTVLLVINLLNELNKYYINKNKELQFKIS